MKIRFPLRLNVAFLAASSLLIAPISHAAESVRCLTEPVRDVEMSSTVPGMVAIIHYGEGSFVESGTVILEFESRSEELDVERRAVLAETLKNTYERSQQLLEATSSISMEEVDEARSEYQMAVLELELAREALNKKHLSAPFSGIITDIPIEVGEYCEPPQVILRMVDPREFYCVANIDPALAMKLEVDDPVVFSPNTVGDKIEVPGRIVFISPVVDPASGLLRIRALFTNVDGIVRPGEGGEMNLIPGE